MRDDTSYEIFLDGRPQGRRRYRTSRAGFEVRCDRNELHLEGYEVTAAYARHL